MSESFFDKFRKKETVIAAGPSPIWHGMPGQPQPQATQPTVSTNPGQQPKPFSPQPPAPAPTPAQSEFVFQPRPQPLSVSTPTQPKEQVTTSSATVVYPRAVPNTGPNLASGSPQYQPQHPTIAGVQSVGGVAPPAFGPYAGGRVKNDEDEGKLSSVLSEDAYVKTKQLVMEKLGKAQLPFVKPKLDKLQHTYKEFEQLTEHVKRLWICVRDIRDTQKLFGEFFSEAASTEEEFVKDPLTDMANAFTETYEHGEELYNTLKSLKETTETFYNAAIADARFTSEEYEKRRVAYDATRQRVSEMQQDNKTDPVTLRNAQNNLEVKRTEFQQIGADLATKMIILNEKRIQILSERLTEYYTVMRRYYSNCSQTFNKTNKGDVHLPIDDSFGTVKFKDLISSLRNEREAKKSESEDNESQGGKQDDREESNVFQMPDDAPSPQQVRMQQQQQIPPQQQYPQQPQQQTHMYQQQQQLQQQQQYQQQPQQPQQLQQQQAQVYQQQHQPVQTQQQVQGFMQQPQQPQQFTETLIQQAQNIQQQPESLMQQQSFYSQPQQQQQQMPPQQLPPQQQAFGVAAILQRQQQQTQQLVSPLQQIGISSPSSPDQQAVQQSFAPEPHFQPTPIQEDFQSFSHPQEQDAQPQVAEEGTWA